MKDYLFTVTERFLRYVQIDTQSDPVSASFPSTEKQKNLSKILVNELKEMGIEDAHLDEYGYVYATISANSSIHVPIVCFCSHVDTAPDCTGENVKPIVHKKYDGNDIVLPDDTTQVIKVSEHPYLLEKIGEDIITASGKTLLGADDKAGVAIIMDFANYLTKQPELKHGKIKILFTPDEEIGRGVDKVDIKRVGADFGYTLDGGERGSYTDETFNADAVTIVFHGVIAHPGYAKDKLVNAMKVAGTFLDLLSKTGVSPETTSNREGFVHPVQIEGIAEKTIVKLIVRDFETKKLKEHEELLEDVVQRAISIYPGSSYTFEVQEQYRNMKRIISQHPQMAEYVEKAMKKSGVSFCKKSARGGTDGSRLSFMGLPCADIFTGEMAFHSKHEYVSVQDMQKSVEVLVNLVQVWEEHSCVQTI